MPGELVLDVERHEVRQFGRAVDLSRSEFRLLRLLMSRPGTALSSEAILVALRGPRWAADTGILQVQVSRLRRKLGESAAHPRHIVTIRGFGYRFEP